MSRLIFAAGVALFALVPSSSFAHGTSKSYADWVIDGSRAEMRVNFAPHDFAVEIAGLDADGDQKVSKAELSKKEGEVLDKVVAATKISAANVRGEGVSACSAERPRIAAIGEPVEEIQVSASFACDELIGFLVLETRYLATLEPPHVSVATVTAGEITAQHIFTLDTKKFELELEPPTIAAALTEHLSRGLRSTFSAAMLLGLGVLCFLAGLRGAGPIAAAFAAAFALALFTGGPRATYVVFIPVAAAGIEALIPRGVTWRRAGIAAMLGAMLGLNAAITAAVPMKIAFLLGAILPAIGVAFAAALLAKYRTRLTERALGATSIAASIAILVLALS
jgi:hypothetical protein